MKLRWLIWLPGCLTLLSGSASLTALGARQAPSASATSSRAIINQYCVSCHNDKVKTANLALDSLDLDRVGENAETWEKVVRKLRGRMMPPSGRPRPDERGFNAVIQHLETSLDAAAA